VLVKSNAATAALDRIQTAFDADDWGVLRAQCASDMTSDDRRRHVLLAVDLEQWIADWRDARAQGLSLKRRFMGSAGDRLAVERVMWSGGSDGGRFEIEYLWLNEVDEQGRIAASITFDAHDWSAAMREGLARCLAIDPATAAVAQPFWDFKRGIQRPRPSPDTRRAGGRSRIR
jgi:hypothetical protein